MMNSWGMEIGPTPKSVIEKIRASELWNDPKVRDAFTEKFRIEWSDRVMHCREDEFPEAVISCCLDNYGDIPDNGIPYGIPNEYAEKFIPVVFMHMFAADSKWPDNYINYVKMNDDQRAAFHADLVAAMESVRNDKSHRKDGT